MRLVGRCGLVIIGVLFAACALSPQMVNLEPLVDVTAEAPRGAGRTLALAVRDTRNDDIVGTRGGVYDTSYIRTAPELINKIAAEVRRGYETLGFTIVAADAQADIALRIDLVAISYEPQGGDLVRGVQTAINLRATSTVGGNTVTGDYREGTGREVLVAPSPATNERRLNDDLAAVLRRLVMDRRLTDG